MDATDAVVQVQAGRITRATEETNDILSQTMYVLYGEHASKCKAAVAVHVTLNGSQATILCLNSEEEKRRRNESTGQMLLSLRPDCTVSNAWPCAGYSNVRLASFD